LKNFSPVVDDDFGFAGEGKWKAAKYLLGRDENRRLLDKNKEIVTLCDPNAKDQHGFTPFHHAVAWANEDMLLWSMQYAAGWRRPWNSSSSIGKHETNLDAINDAHETALIIAAKSANMKVVGILCDVYHYRSRPDVAYAHHTPTVQVGGSLRSRDTQRILNMRDATGRTALSHSCSGSHETISIIRTLLDAVCGTGVRCTGYESTHCLKYLAILV